MIVPGSNQLNRAFRLVRPQMLNYIAWASRTVTSTGTQVSAYRPGVMVKGSIQPVARTLLQEMGLNLQRHYVTIYISQGVVDIRRDVAGDQFQYNGVTFEAISMTGKWLGQDGWNGVLCIEVPSAG